MNKISNGTLQEYCDHLLNNYLAWRNRCDMSNENQSGLYFTFERGSKYIKIIHAETATSHRSVHSFIVATEKDSKFKLGDILKAASWSSPAKNFLRGNILANNYRFINWSGI